MTTRILTVIGLTLLLSACGWHLRGTDMMPTGLDSLYISARDPHSALVRDLERSLDAAGVTVPDNATEANYSLVILDHRSTARTATVNANARISEQELVEEVDFLILSDKGKTLVPENTVSSLRVFEYDEANILATQDERELIRDEMRRDLVNQMLNRLRQLRQASAGNAPAS